MSQKLSAAHRRKLALQHERRTGEAMDRKLKAEVAVFHNPTPETYAELSAAKKALREVTP